MALGGGTFLTQNKVLPGSYINFVSASRATASLSDRGYICAPFVLDWGLEDEIITIELSEFQTNSAAILGYAYTSDKLKNFREIFKNGRVLYAFRLNSGVKAVSAIGEAKYSGEAGNGIRVSVFKEDGDTFLVTTYFNEAKVDVQSVLEASKLLDNDFVIWKKDVFLEENLDISFSGGETDNTVSEESYQRFLSLIESLSFNMLACPSSDELIKDLFVSFTKRMRDDWGIKFQTVVFRKEADCEGIVNLYSTVKEGDEYSLIYWTAGLLGGISVNKSCANTVYDGEYEVLADLGQTDLEKALKSGRFVFHKTGSEIRVLDDINSFVSFTAEKSEDFSFNQVLRVLDQTANDIAVLFNTKYLGKVQNNESGRVSFWNDIVSYNKELLLLDAIENFNSDDIVVEKGKDKKSVTVINPITPVTAMTKLYMTVIVE